MKISRHSKIIELINNFDIETQEELSEKLKESGYDVTQATISRDIRELMLSKTITSEGQQKYISQIPSKNYISERQLMVFKEGVISMDYAQNMLVIKTLVGMAMAVASALDSMHTPELMGCIAGDDTIFCVTKNEENALKLADKLKNIKSMQ